MPCRLRIPSRACWAGAASAALDPLIAAVRAGESRALVVRGDAGVGASAVLEHVAERATGCRIVHAPSAESEMELVFAGSHERVRRCWTGSRGYPRRDALTTAFGLRPAEALPGQRGGTEPSWAKLPRNGRSDDAQWLDRASAQVLAFVAPHRVAPDR